jgi:Gylcosyl hydrolase family 115 C-terminal domain
VKCAALHNMKVIYAQKSAAYGAERRASAADYAKKARDSAAEISRINEQYNTGLPTVGGKWNHMASLPGPWGGQGRQWDMPPLSDYAGMGPPVLGIDLEGGRQDSLADLSGYTRGRRFIDLFNQGKGNLRWKAIPSEPWLKLNRTDGYFTGEQRLWVSVDWQRVPKGRDVSATIAFETNGGNKRISVPVFNPAQPVRNSVKGFVESHGYVSMEAEHFARKQDRDGVAWQEIGGVGRNGTCMGVYPTTVESQSEPDAIVAHSPALEYDFYLFKTGEFDLEVECLPTYPVAKGRGVRLAVSLDHGNPQILVGRGSDVLANLRRIGTSLRFASPGSHRLTVWMVDPGVVIDKIVLYTAPRVGSYLGPPESFRGSGLAGRKHMPKETVRALGGEPGRSGPYSAGVHLGHGDNPRS